MVAVSLTIFGLLLVLMGFFTPPKGIIDNSVLVAIGEVFTFAGSILGIDYKYRFKPALQSA